MSRAGRSGLLALGLALAACWSCAAPSGDSDGQALLADQDYAAALVALKAGNAAAALPHLNLALKRFPESADVHNELGFAHRQMQQLDKALAHYGRALAINPTHRGAHEYIGEAYLMLDDVPSAEQHLAALRSICMLSCEELQDLEKAIAEHRVRRVPR
jgi:tetratricopeptide (TPR) repeat protein